MNTSNTTSKKLASYLAKSNYSNYSFTDDFNTIIENKIEDYNGNVKAQLKSFIDDMRHGCQSGIIGEFIYNSDCKDFYVKHIDDLEDMKEEIEAQLGDTIPNKSSVPHYTFMCWLCFEEYCFDLERTLFES